MLQNIPNQTVTQANNQISPRLMQQAHSKQMDSNYGGSNMLVGEPHPQQHATLGISSQQQQSSVSITQNAGNLILQKGQAQPMTQIGIKDIWRDTSKNQKNNDQQKIQSTLQSLAGINEFKQKVNIMLQNQMYLNMNSQNFTPGQGQPMNMQNAKYDSRQRGVADLKQLNSIWPNEENQIQENKIQHNGQGMGYGYVLGINDLRELKEMRAGIINTGQTTGKTSLSHGEAINNVPVSSLYKKKNNRFDAHEGSIQVNDNGESRDDQRDLKNILQKNNRNHSTRKASGHGQDELVALQAISNPGRSAENTNNANNQMTRVQKMNRSNQYEHIMNGGMLAFSPTNYKDMQNSAKMQGGKKQSIPNGQQSSQPSAEKKFHTFTNSNHPQSRKASQFQINNVNPGDAPKVQGAINDKAMGNSGGNGNGQSFNTYSTNNQKQQQRRKLLFEYGLEKKLQSQGLSAIPSGNTSGSQQPQQIAGGQNNYGFRQPIQSSVVPVYMGPGGPGPWVSGQQNSGGTNQSMKHAFLRKGNQPLQHESQQQNQQLLDCLMNIDIENLDQQEQDRLKFLSDQYQYHLTQINSYQNVEFPRESNFSQYSKMSKKSVIEDALNQSSYVGDSEKKVQDIKSDVYSSQERFKDNEKHLSEVRLLKREAREGEQTPNGGSPIHVGKETAGVIVNATSSQSSSRKQIGFPKNASKKSLTAGMQSITAVPNPNGLNQVISQVASDKNLLKNSSQTRFQIKSGQGFLAGTQGGLSKNTDYGNIYTNDTGKGLSSPHNLSNKRRRDAQTLGGTMQPANNDFISTDDSSFKTRAADNSFNINQTGGSIFDHIKNQQQKRKQQYQAQQLNQNPPPQYRLDLQQNQKPPMTPPNANKKPKAPHPGLAVSDIKVMTSVQRINIFKLLQRREKSKFIGIQQAKLQKLEGTFEVAAKKSARNPDGSIDQKSQNEKFLDIVRRQAFNTTGNTKGIPQNINYEQIRKQWVSDLKAFGVFQQNELWQFGQMTESQQRQILVCNLQQGKFNGLFDEPQQSTNQLAQPQAVQSKSKSKVPEKSNSIWQGASQRRNAYGSALGNVGNNATIEKQNPNAFRNSLNVTSSRQKIGEIIQIEGGGDSQPQRYTQESPQKPFSQENQKNSSISNRSRSISLKDPNVENIGDSINQKTELDLNSPSIQNENGQRLDKTIDIQVKGINGGDAQIIMGEENKDHVDDIQDKQQTNFSFDPENKLTEDLGDYQSKQDQYTRNQSINNVLNSEQSQNQRAEQVIPFQIMNRFEDSKNQFESCLKEIISKMQGQNYQRNRHLKNMGLGLNNYLPNFPKHLINEKGINGQFNQVQIRGGRNEDQGKANQTTAASTIQNDKYKPKFKTEKEKQLAKLRLGEKGIDSDPSKLNMKNKDGTTIGNVPDSTKNKRASESETKNKEGEGNPLEARDDTIPEEVKKPRYFPPRKLPNPFESAAQEQERFIQARKDALAKYSNISKNRFKQDESAPFKYVLRPGNNSKMIMNVLEKSGRLEPKHGDDDSCTYPGWEPADDHYDSLYNFKWKPTSGGIKYDMISKHGLKQLVNHVKGHGNLTTKDNLFINLKAYYETQKMNIYDVVPLTIVLDYLNDDVSDKVENFLSIMKLIDKNIDQDVDVINKKLHEFQLQKEKALKTPLKISNCCHNQQNLWMLKPTGFNRGIGIHIFQTFDQLRDIMSQHYGIGRGARDKSSIFQTHNHNHHRDKAGDNDQTAAAKAQMQNYTFVIQKLIEKPMLYMKRKFDIRQWVLFNSSDGKVYMFDEPYVRTSSKEYKGYDPDLPNEDQIFMQLTNNAVQKDGEDYGKFEEGNIISIQTLFEALKSEPAANNNSQETLVSNFKKRMIEIIIDTMKSVKGKLLMQKHTFELLGYDFIFDEELNTILIEVNTNPCLEESNALLKRILPRMIDDLLNITMDPLFGINGCGGEGNSVSKPNDKYKSKFKLTGDVFGGPELKHPGYPDDKNLWDHIYTMEQQ